MRLVGLVLLIAIPSTESQDSSTRVTGTVSLKGDAPKPENFKTFDGDPAKKLFPDGVTREPIPVDGNKRIRSALVYVKTGLEGRTFPEPKEPKRLDLENCELKPRMLRIMTGQELVVTNKDDWPHNVHALPWKNKEFNPGLRKNESHTCRFNTPEVAIKVRSEILHDWELAWIAVLPHPFYAVTDEQGRYELKSLPPGKYTIEAWQERCEPVIQEIIIQEKESRTVDLVLEARKK